MMEPLRQRFQDATEWIDNRSLRERALLIGGFMVILLVVLVKSFFAPMHANQVKLEQEFKAKLEQVRYFETQIQELIAQSKRDPDKENRDKLAMLTKRLHKLDASLAGVTQGLVSPREMAKLVEEVLARNRRLEVIKVESLPPAPLVDSGGELDGADAAQLSDQLIYKHGMHIELKGGYLDILNYLKALEAMPWKMFWGRVTLVSERHPVSRLRLIVYTLSLHEGWIGV